MRHLWVSIALVWGLVACSARPPAESSPGIPPDAVVIDVRTQAEYDAGHIDGALLIPHQVIGERIAEVVPDTSRPIVVYCRSGYRAGLAQRTLRDLGYTHVINAGGLAEAKQRLGR